MYARISTILVIATQFVYFAPEFDTAVIEYILYNMLFIGIVQDCKTPSLFFVQLSAATGSLNVYHSIQTKVYANIIFMKSIFQKNKAQIS